MRNLNITWLSNCPSCGYGTATVTTNEGNAKDSKKLYEGDSVECKGCGAKGEINCDDGCAWCVWDSEVESDAMNKEEIYDNEISPLMQKIIEICQRNDISMVFSASIPTEESNDLVCTTSLNSNKSDPMHVAYAQAISAIKPSHSVLALVATTKPK